MGTATDPSTLKENRCRYLKGFLPQRLGRMRLAAIPKILQSFSSGVQGLAIWLSEDSQLDTLVILANNNIYTSTLTYEALPAATAAFKYDETLEGQRTRLTAGTPGAVSGASVNVGDVMGFAVQFKTELIFSVNTLLYRYYRTEATGVEHLYQLGLTTPAISSLSQTTGGSLTLLATYSYVITDEDEFGRESSPSAASNITLTGANCKVTITRGNLDTNGGSTHWNVYRRNPGGTNYLFVATIVSGTSTYDDTSADTAIAANDAAPTPGENDKPIGADIGTVWRDRLVLNNFLYPSNIQVSNAGSPTQFSTLPLPTNVADGFGAWVGGKGDNEITGFEELGGMLAIFKRSSMTFLQGDTIENFSLLPIHQRGCANPRSIQRCENYIIFLSNDGVYRLLYENGYIINKISLEIDDLFTGFTSTLWSGEPTSYGQPLSPEVLASRPAYLESFYSRNRYYLSLGNKTLCYDVAGNGWSDTGWGFVNNAVVYKSLQGANPANDAAFPPLLGIPETVVMVRGDIHSNRSTATLLKLIEYFTAVDTYRDVDMPIFPAGHVYGVHKTRYFDGDGPPQNRRKRAKRLTVYGSTSAKMGQRIGQVKGYVGGKLMCVYPIYAWTRIAKQNALFEQEFTPIMVGEEITFDVEFTYPDITLGNHLLEYEFLN